MERTAYYGWFALQFGWTKEQVDEQPEWYSSRLADYVAVHDEVAAEKAKK